jgi:RNA polymerase-interacting CarD/CdnL/TRCF family regulator
LDGILGGLSEGTFMMEAQYQYIVGDWVVHTQYGVGQIKNIEVKPINGKTAACFKVKTRDCTFWFPATGSNNPRIRPIGTREIVHQVIRILRRKPANLDKDKKYWRDRIHEIRSEGDLVTISKLIRNLSGQKALRNLIQSEQKALVYFKERLMGEWAVIMDTDIESIRPRLQAYIQESNAKIGAVG